MAEVYSGVVENGKVVLPKRIRLNNGTAVLIMPQNDSENQWLTVTQAAKQFRVSAKNIRGWMKSAKVRVHVGNPELVSAGDVEDAVEQFELFNLSMKVVERGD